MKIRTFNVSADLMVEFAGLLGEYELEGAIISTNEDDEILVKVEYEPEEHSQAVLEMIDHLEDLDEDYSEEDDE
jgi:DNA-binding HxlR family transcriptional regulator